MWMNIKPFAIGISFLLATLLGNGALWNYWQSQIEKERIKLEVEKQRLESMAASTELRGKLAEVLYKVSSLAGEYHEILATEQKGEEAIGVYPIGHKIKLLDEQVDQLLSDYEAIEANVAKIEGRQPRKLNVNLFKPPPPPPMPQSIRIEGKW
jgi:hypothetical protein